MICFVYLEEEIYMEVRKAVDSTSNSRTKSEMSDKWCGRYMYVAKVAVWLKTSAALLES